jgi:hypothetical protein
MSRLVPTIALLAFACLADADDKAKKLTPKEALQPFNDLIGAWKGVGEPEGSDQEKRRGFWRETVSWEWRFKGDDAWLILAIDKGKHFKAGELRYLPDKDSYQLTLTTTAGKDQVFDGKLARDKRSIIFERKDTATKEVQRLHLNLVGEIRFTYRFDHKPDGRTLFIKDFQVAATREGESFGKKEKKPECVVSGGLGTSTVSYKGVTYYVCCSGCRDAFNENPEKYVKEFNEKKAKEKD